MATTPNLGLPLIEESQAGAHVTVNTALTMVDSALAGGGGGGGGAPGGEVTTPGGGFMRLAVYEANLAASGAQVTASGLIPARAIVVGVTSYTVDAITGAVSYDVGMGGGSEFGGSVGIAAGSKNIGVVGPFATYSPTDVTAKANGGSFTAGTIRLVAHVLEVGLDP